jgi:hypothetical protein
MIENFRQDPIFQFLASNCMLTQTQLDTILAAKNGVNLDEKIKLRRKGKLSKGSFIRSLRQAETNVRLCFCTLILLRYSGLIDPTQWAKFSNVAELIEKFNIEGILEIESARRVVDIIKEATIPVLKQS